MSKPNSRRSIVSSSSYSSNTLHFKSPWVTLWWSAAFPGFGHFMVNSYMWGFFLMSFEYIVNTLSRINMAIFLSMTGNFQAAKSAIDLRYFLLYVVVYVFAMWDAYRRCVDNNKAFQLAYYETRTIEPFHFTAMELNMLEKKKPWLAFVWSFLLPAIGYIYLHRIPAAIFSFIWWGCVLHFSHVLEGISYSFVGDFAQAKAKLNPQWLLYTPSIYCFSMYDSYAKTVENNWVFDVEQAENLIRHYQSGDYDELYAYGR